jgi:hypothetical protein
MEPIMGDDQPGSSRPFDPMESFRGMRDTYLDAMAKAMVETVNTEGYAQASGAMLDTSLTMAAPFREALERTMLQALQQLSLPSRQDFIALAERFTNFEMRLDDIDAKLDQIAKPPDAGERVAKSEPAKLDPLAKPHDEPAVKPRPAIPANKEFKTESVAHETGKVQVTKKRVAAAKQAPAPKRTIGKGAK